MSDSEQPKPKQRQNSSGRGKPRFKYQFRPYVPRYTKPRRRFFPRQRQRPVRRGNSYRFIRYGQQQDLAFSGKTSFKGMGNTFTTPVSESKIVQSFFKFQDDIITFCQPIPANCYVLASATIPIHPMFYFGRTANMALNFANFAVKRIVIHYVPLIGSTSTGMIAIGSTRHCTPLTYDVTTQFSQLTQINAEINPVWMCSRYSVKDIDTTMKNMAPVNRNDIPNNVYVVGSGLANTLALSCTIFAEMSFQLSRPSPSPALTPYSSSLQIIISAAGIRSNTVTTSNMHGIVMNTGAQNIDMGEYIECPPFPVVATDYDINLTHNNCSVDYASALDQGTIYILYFLEN